MFIEQRPLFVRCGAITAVVLMVTVCICPATLPRFFFFFPQKSGRKQRPLISLGNHQLLSKLCHQKMGYVLLELLRGLLRQSSKNTSEMEQVMFYFQQMLQNCSKHSSFRKQDILEPWS